MDLNKAKLPRPYTFVYFTILFSHFCKKLFAVLRNSVLKTRGNARKQQFHVAVYNGKWYHFVAWQIGITT